jgi:hypothetical protein
LKYGSATSIRGTGGGALKDCVEGGMACEWDRERGRWVGVLGFDGAHWALRWLGARAEGGMEVAIAAVGGRRLGRGRWKVLVLLLLLSDAVDQSVYSTAPEYGFAYLDQHLRQGFVGSLCLYPVLLHFSHM